MSLSILSFALQVERARQAGYSDHEILDHLRTTSSTWAERVQAATQPGDSPAQTMGRLLADAEMARLDPNQALNVLGEDNGRTEIEAFMRTLGARVDAVVARGTADPKMAGGVSWEEWHHQRNNRIFAEARRQVSEPAEAREAREKAERKAWEEHWRAIQHGWTLFCRALDRAPVEAEKYRALHEDPQAQWLVDLGTGKTEILVWGRDVTRGKL
jgi:hypothetical protein